MKEILLFAGTTEGRKLSECLSAAGIPHTVCVATEYGEITMGEHPLAKIRRGRMDRREMAEWIRQGDFMAVADATHPYAEEVTDNIRAALEGTDIPYIRIKRETGGAGKRGGRIFRFDTLEACAAELEKTEGNILLTTGSKDLGAFCASEKLRERLYVRVLPGLESLRLCMEQGISGKQILALQGPFTAEMNEAMIRQYRIQCLVTKASGRTGGYQAKLEAAEKTGISVFVVGSHEEDPGCSFQEACKKIGQLCGKKLAPRDRMEILLAGAGMGGENSLTEEVRLAVESADLLFGSERLISRFHPRIEKKPYYQAEQILPYLKEMQESLSLENGRVVVLFSGDTGFYSGCKSLYRELLAEIRGGGLSADVRILPGISSVACLAACIGESYQDAVVFSMHGRKVSDPAGWIAGNRKTFLLMSGPEDVRNLGSALLEAGMSRCRILAGFQLSYQEQRILDLTPEECCGVREEGLYTCFVENPCAVQRELTPGKADGEFIREKVPMTKAEVREVSICKLKLRQGAVVYDIGSGTGSVAVEIAGLSGDIPVYAIERREEAVRLIKANREKFRLPNIQVIAAEAPEGFVNLPVPTHAFIGGSGGRLREILAALYQKNPEMRVVINAVSLETICEIRDILSQFPVKNPETVQLQVSRAKQAGEHHLMLAENPVWICAFDFCAGESDPEEPEAR